MDKKTIKSLIYKAASLLLLSIFLCTSVFIYLQKSFGWFSDNDEVSASGLSVQSSEGLDVRAEFNDPDPLLGGAVKPNISKDENNPFVSFANLHPGNKIYVNLDLLNYESSAVNVTLSLKAPTEEDDVVVETVENGQPKYTYFGAHLRINSMKLNGTDQMLSSLTGTKRYLLDYVTNDNDTVHDTFFSAPYNFESNTADKQLTGTITIPGATDKDHPGKVTLVLEIEFVDNAMVQNPLIDFGTAKKDENGNIIEPAKVCTRMLICTTEEVPN